MTATLPKHQSGRPRADIDGREVVRRREAGESWRAIAARLGVGTATAMRAYNQLSGVPKPSQNSRPHAGPSICPEPAGTTLSDHLESGVSRGSLKLKFPVTERATLQPAIDTLRSGKVEALARLPEGLNEHGPPNGEKLESVLRDRAIELWSTAAGRLLIVAHDADAQRLIKSDPGVRRGEVYTASEVRLVIKIGDPETVAEVHRWKREFNGQIRAIAPSSKEATR